MTRETLLERFASPFHRTLRTREKLVSLTRQDARRAKLLARGYALTSQTPLHWNQVAMMLAVEEKASR